MNPKIIRRSINGSLIPQKIICLVMISLTMFFFSATAQPSSIKTGGRLNPCHRERSRSIVNYQSPSSKATEYPHIVFDNLDREAPVQANRD
jgi:hypothetical protein